jgi:hypothetical protein
VIDGMSGAEILGALLDLSPEGREPPQASPTPAARPGQLELFGRGLLGVPRYPLRLLRSVPRALPNIDEVPTLSGIPGLKTAGRAMGIAQRAVGRGPVVGHLNLVPPHTSFIGRITELPLADVKQLKAAHRCTVNDVIVSMCAGAVPRWLIEHDELPAEPLVAQVPVSVCKEDQHGTFGNRILLMTAQLYANIEDPLTRLRETHAALAGMKERHRALPAELLSDANQFIPPALFSRAARLTFSLSASKRAHPALEPRRLQRARPPVPAVHGRLPARGAVSDLGGHRRDGPQHHGDELPRRAQFRDRRRSRADARPVVADRVVARRGRRARAL